MTYSVEQILADPGLNGVYRLDAPSELLPTLDGRILTDKDTLLAALGWALEFPDYFGANWDALEECLTDMAWRPGAIALHVGHAAALDPELLDVLVDVFSDAADYWQDQGRACSLFLSGLDDTELSLVSNCVYTK